MTIRLLFACLLSLALLGLIPYLNKSRTAKEMPIVSYRLHSFETKNTPVPMPVEKKEVEIKLEKAIEISTVIPKPMLLPTTMSIQSTVSPNLQFLATSFSGSSVKSGDSVPVTDVPVQVALPNLNYQLDGGDHLIFGPKPNTPLRARQMGINGSVKAQFEVNEKGLVENIQILNSSNEIFDKPVKTAIKQYRFKPYTDQNGNLIKVLLTKEFLFEVH